MSWRDAVSDAALRGANRAEDLFDEHRARFFASRREDDETWIQSYLGIGSRRELMLRGRVLHNRPPSVSADRERLWRNLLNSWRRFETDEVRGARVNVESQEEGASTVTDDEGYFTVRLETSTPAKGPWQEAAIEVLDQELGKATAIATATVRVPEPGCRIGIISDVDDTVLHSNATHKAKLLWATFSQSARTRKPMPGVGALYSALTEGAGSSPLNPIAYVSSSPFNLHDLLEEFLELQDLPRGPLFLRDLGLTTEHWLKGTHSSHKVDSVAQILEMWDPLPFVLLGDSGQHDPQIYAEIAEAYPDRVTAIYIRDVSDRARDREVQKISRSLSERDVPMLLTASSHEMAEHAASLGLIDEARLADIREDEEADRTADLEV